MPSRPPSAPRPQAPVTFGRPYVALADLGLVMAGGAVGSLARWCLAQALSAIAHPFPWPTYLANVVGSFLLGWLTAALQHRGNDRLRLAAGVGALGGFTTFSTFSVELVTLIQDGSAAMAALYLLASLSACVVGAAVGFAVGHARAPRQAPEE